MNKRKEWENNNTMEMTQQEYMKEWKRRNPDYFHNYYLAHKEHMLETARLWREANKGDFIYFYVNTDGDNLYIGSTGGRCFIERASFHLCSHSNLKMSAEDLVNDYNLECILYKDLTEYNLSRNDLYYLEKFYIEKEGAILNKKPINIEGNLTRSKEELINIAEKNWMERI